MNKTVAAAIAACAVCAACAEPVEIDGIAATVGSATILRSDILSEMRRAGVQDDSRFGEFRSRLIERALMLKDAADSKLTMQEWIVEDRVKTVIDNAFSGDRNKLVEALARDKVTYADWRRRIKEDMIVGAMRWNVVDKNVLASPAAMRAEYDAHPERYQAEPRVTVSVVLLKPEDREKRAEVNETIAAKGFAEAARVYSADTHAKDGGVWKDIKPEDVFRQELCEEIAKTPAGEISDWIDLDGWSFLFRKDAEAVSKPRTFAEAYADIELAVKEAEAKRLYDAWMERLKAATYIHIW